VALPERISDYCALVCQQIRWKKTHDSITRELTDHLLAQRDAYYAEGYPMEAAEAQAILDFGDPVMIGSQLDRVHRPKSQWACFAIVAALCLCGLLAQTLSALSAPYGMNPQLGAYFLGAAVLTGCYFMDFSVLSKHTLWFYFIVAGISVALHIFPIYVNLRSCIVLLYPLAIACGIYHFRKKGNAGIVISTALAAMLFLLSLWMNSMAGAILSLIAALSVIPYSVCMGWFGAKRKGGLLIWAGLMLFWIAAALLPELLPMLRGRIWQDSYISGLIDEVLQSARWFGMAEPLSHTLPAMHTDYILTFLLYRFGWLAFGIVTGLLALLLLLCFHSVGKQKSILGRLVSFSITLGFAVEIIGYLFSNLGIAGLPSFTLPFVSYGVFANLIHFSLLGILLSVFRNGEIMSDSILTAKTI